LEGKTEDKNGDGMEDLILSFNLHDMEITDDTQEICLEGLDESGIGIKGCDGIEFTSSSW